MLGNIIVFAVAVSLVATYIFIVNRFLRSDKHWNENGALDTSAPRERKANAVVPVTSHGSLALN
jgi:hypothetical protein